MRDDVIELIKRCDKGEIKKEEIGRLICWGFSDEELNQMANLYKTSNKNTQNIIEYVLTDCNFHEECRMIKKGEWKELNDVDIEDNSKEFTLKFDDKNLFNIELLQQYDNDGQRGFLGYLLRYKKWEIDKNKIVFPDIKSSEEIQKALSEYNIEIKKDNFRIKNAMLEKVSIFGLARCEQMLKSEQKEIEKTNKDLKQRLDRAVR